MKDNDIVNVKKLSGQEPRHLELGYATLAGRNLYGIIGLYGYQYGYLLGPI